MVGKITSFHYAMLLAYLAAGDQINYNSGLVWPNHEYHENLIILDDYTNFSSVKAYVARNIEDKAIIEDTILSEHKQSYHPKNAVAFDIITKYSISVYEVKHEVQRMIWPNPLFVRK